MKKRDYQKPTMQVVQLRNQELLDSASITDVDGGDTGIVIGGGSDGGGRSRQGRGWFDDED